MGVTAFLGLMLIGSPSESASPGCKLGTDHRGITFPVDRLPVDWRCRLGIIVDGYTTIGSIGPTQTPIRLDFYHFLLDRPKVIADLLERLEIGNFQVSPRDQGRFWVNDGDGTQGLVTALQRDEITSIFHLEGYHEGRIFSRIHGEAALFLRTRPVITGTGLPGVETTLVAYTKLEHRVWSPLAFLLRPFINGWVTRKVTKGFGAPHRLSLAMIQDPERVSHEASFLTSLDPSERAIFRSNILASRQPSGHRKSAHSIP